jgi:hypothetical protein
MQEHDLDRSQNNTGVDMLELWHDSLTNMLCLLDVCGLVVCQSCQDRYSSPLCALIQRQQHLLECLRSDDQRFRLRGRLHDFHQRGHRVCHDHGVGIADKLLQLLQKAVLQAHRG